MNKHVTDWLGAYHDGELHGRQLQWVEAHLARCEVCRAELEKLQALTALLQEAPKAETLTQAERFVAQVGLRLPRHPARPAWHRALELGWRIVPLGLFGAWAFVRAVFIVADVLQIGLGGGLAAKLLPRGGFYPPDGLYPPSPQGTWLAEVLRMAFVRDLSSAGANDIGRLILHMVSERMAFIRGGPLGWGMTLNLASLSVIGLLYWSWLASWWAHRKSTTGG
jgi:anti-sigma factor RsiW